MTSRGTLYRRTMVSHADPSATRSYLGILATVASPALAFGTRLLILAWNALARTSAQIAWPVEMHSTPTRASSPSFLGSPSPKQLDPALHNR